MQRKQELRPGDDGSGLEEEGTGIEEEGAEKEGNRVLG